MRLSQWMLGCCLGLLSTVVAAQTAPVPSSTAATPAKVLRYAFPVAETGFDPAQINDLYSSTVIAHIFDPPLRGDTLSKTPRLRPNTAAALPEVSADYKVWTVRIRPGIYFADDPAFKGQKRELTAADYVYSIKRHFDPKFKSQVMYVLDGFIVGMQEVREQALKTGQFDYQREIPGLRTLDRYTFRIELNQPRPMLLYQFASTNLMGAVAREVVEHYGQDIMAHPVGTGPFRLAQWRRSSRIVLERNPAYREEYYDEQPDPDDAEGQAIAQRLKGRRLPMLDRVEVYIVEEDQPRWLAFLNAEHDLMDRVPAEFVVRAAPGGKLSADLARRGVQMSQATEYALTYTYFGMNHPVVGGMTPEKVALRRAIALAYRVDDEVRLLRRGQAQRARSTVPPGVNGYDPHSVGEIAQVNPARAKAILDAYGYVDRNGDGYRENPDGSVLTLEFASTPDNRTRAFDELWKKSLDAVGLRLSFRKAKWPELIKESRAGRLMMFGLGWGGSFDGDGFYTMLYGPNAGQSNHARFNHPDYNALYEKSRLLPHSPERSALYREMDKIIFAYAPLRPNTHRLLTGMAHRWVVGYRRDSADGNFWSYVDIDNRSNFLSK
jgi:ABC-type transport system substrate-binding protein